MHLLLSLLLQQKHLKLKDEVYYVNFGFVRRHGVED